MIKHTHWTWAILTFTIHVGLITNLVTQYHTISNHQRYRHKRCMMKISQVGYLQQFTLFDIIVSLGFYYHTFISFSYFLLCLSIWSLWYFAIMIVLFLSFVLTVLFSFCLPSSFQKFRTCTSNAVDPLELNKSN